MDASSRRAASPSKASSSGRVQERRGRVERGEGPWKRWWEDLKQRWRGKCGTHPEDRGDEDETRTSRSSSFDSAMSSSFGAISDVFRSRMVLEEMEEEGDGPGTNGIDVHHERTEKRKQALFLPGKRYIINPMSMTYRVWWMGTALVALLNSFFVPIEIGFSKQPGLPPYNDATAIIQYIVDAIFLLDIIVIFNLACFDNMGRLVKERKKIAKQYCKFYFWIDVLVLFPLDWVALAMSGNVNNGGSTAAQYTSLLRLLQLLRLYRFGQLQKKLLFYQKFSLEVVIVARVAITFLFLANIFASGFYFIARQGNVECILLLRNLHCSHDCTWRYACDWRPPCLAEADRVCCGVLHFVPLAGKVGYGEIAPVGTAEQTWCMICILLGISNLAYIQFSLFLLAKSDPKTSNYRDFSEILATYCRLNSLQDIEPSMQQQLKLQYLAAEMSDDVVLQGFPLAVKQKVLGAIYLEFIQRCSLFSGIEQGFLEEFLSRSSVDLFMPGVDLVQKGFVPTHLLILLNGTASTDMDVVMNDSISVSDLRLEQENELQSSKEIHAGNVITEVGFLTRTPQSFQVRALTLCKVLTLARDSFDELINIHPDAMKVLLENVLRRLKQNIEQLQQGSGLDNTSGASSVRNAESQFWLPKHRRALDAVRMSINRYGSQKVSEFLDLAFAGDLPGVEAAIATGMNINSSNYDGRTALMIASSRGFRQVVHALLRAGAEVNAVDSRLHSALLEATLFGHDKIIKLLLEHKAEIRAPSEKQASLLCTATGEGNLALVKRLLQAGVDPNAEDYGQRTALHVAISVGNLPAVNVLFLHGAKLKKDSRWKDTHLAYSQLMERKVISYFETITD